MKVSMTSQLNEQTGLHEFPLPPEFEDVSFVDLSTQAMQRFAGSSVLSTIDVIESDKLSYGTNKVLVVRADKLPGNCFKYLSGVTSVAENVENGTSAFALATAGSYGIATGHGINLYGGRATAFVPEDSSQKKQTLMEELGVEVIVQGANFDESMELAILHAARYEKRLLHPFASKANIAATGILGIIALLKAPQLTHIVTQVGGASLAGGVLSVVGETRPDVQKVAVQVEGCSPVVDSLRSGQEREATDLQRRGRSYFNGLGGVGVGRTNPMTLGLISRSVDAVDTVRHDYVSATIFDVCEELGVLPEFAAASGLEDARQLARKPYLKNARILAFMTGTNVDGHDLDYFKSRSRSRELAEVFGR